ncbi:DUF6731 family protein [Comamonas guangdongensis]|uniref:DUF6731 family protein n=1 Tax=Comamonas guangdongensis TaxID=510515 RepID=A0ABV3ZTV0_9BURK
MAVKQMTAEFYAMHAFNPNDFSAFYDFLVENKDGHAPSIALDKKNDGTDADEKYQIRSISTNRSETVIKAVFGRCRFNENLEQASEGSDDKDVELLPGHGLVEKNHFLFFKENNLVVYQKNGNGSNIGKLQRYLVRNLKKEIALEAVLTEDSYRKLLDSGPLKKLEISVVPPPFSEIEEENYLRDVIKEFESDNAKRIKLVLSADAQHPLPPFYKQSLADLTRAGWTKVARATVAPIANFDKSDDAQLKDEIIDLILNRIKKDFEVVSDDKNKIPSLTIWQGLAKAKDECNQKLKAFFDPN